MRFFLLHQTLTTMSLFAVNNQKPPKPWKIISWFGSSSSGLGDKGGKAPAQRKESPAEPKDIQRAKRLNERFTAFKKELGAYYRAYALKSVYGIQIKKYVPAQLGGVDSDKFRPISNGQSVIDKMLQKRFGISLKQFEEKTITELRKIFGKAESTPAPKKAEKKSEPKKAEKKAEPKKPEPKKVEKKAEKKTPTPKPAPKKAETVPPIKKVEPAPAPVPKTEAPSEQEGIKQLDEIKALITSAIQNKKG